MPCIRVSRRSRRADAVDIEDRLESILDALIKKPWADVESHLRHLFIGGQILEYRMVGSVYTLGKGRDIDFAVLVNNQFYLQEQPEWLVGEWVREGADVYEGDSFASYRRGDINIIVMHDRDFYQKFLTAMEVCKVLKLQTRKQRVLVCRIVRDGMTAEQADSISIPGEQT